MSVDSPPLLSVVIPMFNEEDVLPILVERLRPVLDKLGERYEVVAVDDGSTDSTPSQLATIRREWPELRIIRLRRNAGHQAALTAGLHQAVGEYVVSLDADLQDPPEKIPDMLELARAENLDIVYGIRNDRTTDTPLKRHTAAAYYRLMHRIAGVQVRPNAGDFRLLSRTTVDTLKDMPEHQPVYRLLIPWVGFPSGEVHYKRDPRAAGTTKYPLTKMIRLATDSITNFSAAPLRLATWLGAISFFFCLLMLTYVVIAFALQQTVQGWASVLACVLFLGGVQLLCLGLLGEYLGRLYAATQHRPAYFIASDTATTPNAPAGTRDSDSRTPAGAGTGSAGGSANVAADTGTASGTATAAGTGTASGKAIAAGTGSASGKATAAGTGGRPNGTAGAGGAGRKPNTGTVGTSNSGTRTPPKRDGRGNGATTSARRAATSAPNAATPSRDPASRSDTSDRTSVQHSINPPAVRSPAYDAPAFESADFESAGFESAGFESPVVGFPAVKSPGSEPLDVKSPGSEPPAVKSPDVEPPAVKSPGVEPPGVKSRGVEPPGVKSPSVEPPGHKSPSVEPPGHKSPSVEPPGLKSRGVEPPAVDAPTDAATPTDAPSNEPSPRRRNRTRRGLPPAPNAQPTRNPRRPA